MKKRILSMLLVIVLVLSMVPVSALAEEGGEQGTAQLEVYQANGKDSVKVGGNVNLTVRMTDGSKPGTVSWSAEPEDLVELIYANPKTVKVKGLAVGTVTITATNANGLNDSFELLVKPGATTDTGNTSSGDSQDTDDSQNNGGSQNAGDSQNPGNTQGTVSVVAAIVAEKTIVYTGKTLQLKAVDADGKEVKDVNWGTSAPAVATADWTTGVLTGVAAGTVDAIAKQGDVTVRKTFTIKENQLKITDAAGNPVEKVSVGETVQLQVRDSDGDVVEGATWSSNKTKIATVGTTGELKGGQKGSAIITATKDGFAEPATQTIAVENKSFVVFDGENELTNGSEITIYVGDSRQLLAKNGDEDVNVAWSTEAAEVTVDNGLLTGVSATAEGASATIKASLNGYNPVTLNVKVVEKSAFRNIKLDNEDGVLYVNIPCRLIALDASKNEVEGVQWTVVSGEADIEGDMLTVRASEVANVVVRAEHPDFEAKTKKFTNIDVKEPDSVTILIEGNELDGDMIEMISGDALGLSVQSDPVDVSFAKGITVTSSVPSVADVVNGKLVAYQPGTTRLTFKYEGNVNGVSTFNVGDTLREVDVVVVPTTQIVLEPSMYTENQPEYTLLAGDELVLKAYLMDTATGNKIKNVDVVWKLVKQSDKDYCRLDQNTLDTKSELVGMRTIELVASVDSTKYDAESVSYTVYIVPRTSAISLWVGDKKVNDKETVLNLNDDDAVNAGVTITATIAPDEANQGVVWQISDDLGIYKEEKTEAQMNQAGEWVVPASITLWPNNVNSKRSGVITVKAVAKDGTKVFATTTVRFAKLGGGELEGAPTMLRGGASLDLYKYLTQNEDLDDKSVTWSLVETQGESSVVVKNGKSMKDGKVIATISQAGKLTTKPVQKETKITVSLKGSNGSVISHTITLYPATKSIAISAVSKDGSITINGTNKTIKFQKNLRFDLTATVKPDVCADWKVVWSTTDKRVAAFNEEDELVILDAGKVRIDCTTTDGSKIKGSLYLEITKDAANVEIKSHPETLTSGKSMDLTAVVWARKNVKAANQEVKWSISDEYGNPTSAAIVSSTGRVTAKDVDHNTIVVVTATSVTNSEVFGTTGLTILPNTKKTLHAYIDGEMISGTLVMDKGESYDLEAMWQKSASGVETVTKDCLFFSSNTNVATVDENTGTLAAVGFGTSTITLRCVDPVTKNEYTSKFTVKVMKVNTVTMNTPDQKYLRSGQSVGLSAIAWADLAAGVWADNQSFTWEVTDLNGKQTTAATINANGVLTAGYVEKRHDVLVKAISKENSVYAEAAFVIIPAEEVRLKFLFNGQEYSNILPVDLDTGCYGLTVMAHIASVDQYGNIYDYDAYPTSVTWSTDNKNVVDVIYNGLYAKAVGSARLNAECVVNGETYWASITAQVNRRVGSVTIEQPGVLVSGKSINMRAKAANQNATNKNVLWSVEGADGLATINQYTGLLKAKPGIHEKKTIVVHAKPADGSPEATLPVTIYPAATKVQVKIDGADVTGTKVEKSLTAGTFTVTAKAKHVYKENGVQVIKEAYSDVFKWTSSNTSVAEVNESGVVTIKKTGTVTIKAIAQDGTGKTAKFTLRVTN